MQYDLLYRYATLNNSMHDVSVYAHNRVCKIVVLVRLPCKTMRTSIDITELHYV
jgi:hypothetical protein